MATGDRWHSSACSARPATPRPLRAGGNLLEAPDGIEPVFEGRILQGFLESSNVEPMGEIARMIEVQRAYEMGQSFLEAENERVRNALDTFTR